MFAALIGVILHALLPPMIMAQWGWRVPFWIGCLIIPLLAVTLCVGISNFIWLPIMGGVSDRIGRRPVLITFTLAALLTSYPMMLWLVSEPSFLRLLMSNFGFHLSMVDTTGAWW